MQNLCVKFGLRLYFNKINSPEVTFALLCKRQSFSQTKARLSKLRLLFFAKNLVYLNNL